MTRRKRVKQPGTIWDEAQITDWLTLEIDCLQGLGYRRRGGYYVRPWTLTCER